MTWSIIGLGFLGFVFLVLYLGLTLVENIIKYIGLWEEVVTWMFDRKRRRS